MATRRAGNTATWYTEDPKNNPTSTTDLALTPALPLGEYEAECFVSVDASCVINVQLVATGGVVKQQRLYYGGAARDQFIFPVRSDAADYFVRIRPNANVTGNVSASVILQRLA